MDNSYRNNKSIKQKVSMKERVVRKESDRARTYKKNDGNRGNNIAQNTKQRNKVTKKQAKKRGQVVA